MPSVQLSFEQIIELVQQLSPAQQTQLVELLQPGNSGPGPELPAVPLTADVPAEIWEPEPIAPPAPPPIVAARREAPAPPPPPAATTPGSGLMSRFSGLGQEAAVGAAMQQQTSLEALQQASRSADGGATAERLGSLKSFTSETRQSGIFAKAATGGILGRFGKPEATAAAPSPEPSAPPPPPPVAEPRVAPGVAVSGSGLMGRFGAAPAAPEPPPAAFAAPAVPPAPEPPRVEAAAVGGILGRFGGGAAAAAAVSGGGILGRFGGGGSGAPPPGLGGLGAGSLGKPAGDSRLAPPAGGGSSLMNRFGSAPRQDPPAPMAAPAESAPVAPPAPLASPGASLMSRFGDTAAPAAAAAPAGGLMGRFAGVAAEASLAPAPAVAAATSGASMLNRFAAMQSGPPPREATPPQPPPEPEPASIEAPAAPGAFAGGPHWERALHELFAGVRKQSAYIAREELAEQMALAIEEVRQQ